MSEFFTRVSASSVVTYPAVSPVPTKVNIVASLGALINTEAVTGKLVYYSVVPCMAVYNGTNWINTSTNGVISLTP